MRSPAPVTLLASIANLVKEGIVHPTVYSCNKLIEAFSRTGFLSRARQLFDAMPERNVFTWNTMIHGYIRNDDMVGARSLFDTAPEKDPVTYNSMISGFAGASCKNEAMELFDEMREKGVRVDGFALTTMLNVAAELGDLGYGKRVHTCMVKTGNDGDRFGASSLIDMYSKCESFSDVIRVFHMFERMDQVDTVSRNAMVAACCREGEMGMAFDLFWGAPVVYDAISWNTLISGCVQNSLPGVAMELVLQMGIAGIKYNEHTMAGILAACSITKSLKHGKQVHAWVLKNGYSSNPFICSSIVDFYCKCDELRCAHIVHVQYCDGNVFSTTSLIVGYSQKGSMEEAKRLFDSVEVKNSVIWTAIFGGYIRSSRYNDVLDLFRKAAHEGDAMISDELILVHVLVASSMQTSVEHGRQVHSHVTRMCVTLDEKLSTALVDMYSKCGIIKYAEEIFKRCDMKDRVMYNSMMAGFACNGLEGKAIELFDEMMEQRLQPDAVTFIALLSACRHAGLVELGEKYFYSMSTKYNIDPEIDHYSCMIDLLGRANQLGKAFELIKSMPFAPDAITWGTFLSACRVSRNTELAKEAEKKLAELVEVTSCSRFVQLANTFAAKGEWSEVERIRRKMRGRELKKHAGCSWLQVGNKLNIFISGDVFHTETRKVYEMLATVYAQMTDADEAFVSDFVFYE